MSVNIPVSSRRTRAAFAVGASPNTGRVLNLVEVVDRGLQHGGLARTGRPDHQDESVPAGDGRGGVGLHHVEVSALDGGGRRCGSSSWLSIAHDRMCSSWVSTRSLVKCVSIGAIHTERPSERRRRSTPVGSMSTQASRTRSVLRSNTPTHSLPGDAGLWPDAVAQGAHHVEAIPTRALRQHLHHLADRHRLGDRGNAARRHRWRR